MRHDDDVAASPSLPLSPRSFLNCSGLSLCAPLSNEEGRRSVVPFMVGPVVPSNLSPPRATTTKNCCGGVCDRRGCASTERRGRGGGEDPEERFARHAKSRWLSKPAIPPETMVVVLFSSPSQGTLLCLHDPVTGCEVFFPLHYTRSVD